MKKIFLFSILFLPLLAIAQSEGTIVYEETVKLDIKIPEGMEEMFAKMPKERTSKKVLYFNGGESLYTILKDKVGSEDDEMSMSNGGLQIKFKMNEPDNRTYINRDSKEVTRKQDLLGKAFIIEDELPKYAWKIGSERQKIMDHVCMKASAAIDDSTSIVAWFSTQLPISLGPQEYQGLPGVILALELNVDERIIVASDIDFDPLDESVIEKPTKGKRVSSEEFEAIRKQKMAEMQAEHGGRGVHIITRN